MTEPAKPPSIAALVAEASERQRAGQAYGETGAALKEALDKRRRAIVRQYARGEIAAARLSSLIDEAVGALYAAGAAAHPSAGKDLGVAAVGGYGRSGLAPYSDIDLLFLHRGDEKTIRPLLDLILYPLWDAGLKVGHSVHTPASAAAFAQEDMIARTAFLDSRPLAGPPALYDDFRKRFDKLRKRTGKQFFAAKRTEQDERRTQTEQSRYLAEPDIKEGKGGFRDLHVIRWLYKYEYERDIDDEKARKKLLSPEDLKAFRKCERFLWSVRMQLHDLRGRADEKLTFDIQPALADRLGYADRAGMGAAERLMKHYFVNAMEVGRLTRIFSAKFDEEQNRLSPRALKTLPKTLTVDEAGGKANLKLVHGRLAFESPAKARRNPVDFFRLFRAFSRRPDFDFHPDALAAVSSSVALVTSDVRRDPVIAKLFMATLTQAKEPVKTLRVMAETGLLGKYIPSLGRVIGRIEYGLYRRFSIDENIYQSVGVLTEIASGAAKENHPIASRILEKADSPAVYYVAVLLHETGWSLRDNTYENCERLVARIAKRLGLDENESALAAWGAARHLMMVRTAERRNLAEAQAVATFAKAVGDQARLDLLLVLSVCHLRVVGAYSWDDWTRRQLTELYWSASAWLKDGDEGLARRLDERATQARGAAAELLTSWSAPARSAFLARISDAMFRTVDAAMIARIADLARAAEEEGASAAVAARLHDGDVEALVYADDRTGLLADLAGAVAAAGASVRSLQAMTTTDGKAVDVFRIQSPDGAPIEDADLVRRLHTRLLAAAKAPPKNPPAPARRFGDRRSIFSVPPVVRLDLDSSADCVVVEAEGRDRPGLLYELTAALAEIGVTIISAHIATYGARAVDAFYLQDAPGYKITNKRRLQSIERRLLGVLSDDGAQARSALTPKP